MKIIGSILIIAGIILISIFGYQLYDQEASQKQSLAEAETKIEQGLITEKMRNEVPTQFTVNQNEAFATLEIPKLGKTLPVIEGTDPDDLKKGVGHLSNSVFPGQGEQILLSGHRDTVFRNFGELKKGDYFIVNMPYDTYTYEIRETEIVPADDTTVIRKMGEEVLVVTTCYPFQFIGDAPERFVVYAYPVEKGEPALD